MGNRCESLRQQTAQQLCTDGDRSLTLPADGTADTGSTSDSTRPAAGSSYGSDKRNIQTYSQTDRHIDKTMCVRDQ